jgi:hypothetical protein
MSCHVTLPGSSLIAKTEPPLKYCHGDIHRMMAPLPEAKFVTQRKQKRYIRKSRANPDDPYKHVVWTTEHIEEVRRLLDLGTSRAKIAEALNLKFPQTDPDVFFTKNSVIGILARLAGYIKKDRL